MVQNSNAVVALILAGGSGVRFGAELPKQFVKVGHRSILQHTMEAFCPHVDTMVIVCHPSWAKQVTEFVNNEEGTFPPVADTQFLIADGGQTGFDSLCSGISALSMYDDTAFVMIHDAVRPLVTEAVITSNLAVARRYGNAITSVDTYETLFSASDTDRQVHSMLRREGVFRAQTPQTFTLGALREMIAEAQRRHMTDVQSACVLAYELGYDLHLSTGDLINFKITTPSDLLLYKALICR